MITGDPIKAFSPILTRVTRTVINIFVTVFPFVTHPTDAMIIVYFVSASPPILARRYETLIDIYVAQGSHVSRLTLAVESPRKVYTRGIIGTW